MIRFTLQAIRTVDYLLNISIIGFYKLLLVAHCIVSVNCKPAHPHPPPPPPPLWAYVGHFTTWPFPGLWGFLTCGFRAQTVLEAISQMWEKLFHTQKPFWGSLIGSVCSKDLTYVTRSFLTFGLTSWANACSSVRKPLGWMAQVKQLKMSLLRSPLWAFCPHGAFAIPLLKNVKCLSNAHWVEEGAGLELLDAWLLGKCGRFTVVPESWWKTALEKVAEIGPINSLSVWKWSSPS